MYWKRENEIDHKKNKRLLKQLLVANKPIKLELGSAKRNDMESWTTIDLNTGADLRLDLSQPLPFPENSVEIIYSSHVLEHFSYPKPMTNLLSECLRILRPGGTFLVAVPDAKIFLDAYHNPKQFDLKKYCSWDVGLSYKTKIDYVNFIAYMGGDHKHLFDEDNLIALLKETGFQEVKLNRNVDSGSFNNF
jgi:predicted SAM-dependent methyltransferase